ncbi:MAG: DUF3006 domain-containing protein [Chloroflexota bacterium]
MRIRLIIDRFEGTVAVCENEARTMVNMPRSKLPPLASEGDVLIVDGDRITIDRRATEERRKRIADLSKELWQDPK